MSAGLRELRNLAWEVALVSVPTGLVCATGYGLAQAVLS